MKMPNHKVVLVLTQQDQPLPLFASGDAIRRAVEHTLGRHPGYSFAGLIATDDSVLMVMRRCPCNPVLMLLRWWRNCSRRWQEIRGHREERNV